MKLVVSYTVGDGCTYFCDIDVPVEYDSPEQLYCDLEEAIKSWLKMNWLVRPREIEFNGLKMDPTVFLRSSHDETLIVLPTIVTLEEWFDTHQVFKKEE